MPKESTHYVAGFMFSPSLSSVALIRKAKPDWQRGKLNGIGGKVEAGEHPRAAMVREFQEETGHATESREWNQFAAMHDEGAWKVDFFVARGDVAQLRTMEEEPIEIVPLDALLPGRLDMIENLSWLLPLALDCLRDRQPFFVEVHY